MWFCKRSNPREIVRIRTSGSLNTSAARSSAVITTVPDDKILVIETISLNIRVKEPYPEVASVEVITGSTFPPGTGSPLIHIPMTKMAIDPAGDSLVYVGLENMRVYADETVQYFIDMSSPCSGAFNLSLYGYLLPAGSPCLSP